MSNDDMINVLSCICFLLITIAYSVKFYDWNAQRKAKKRMDEFVRIMTE